ncbi:MAG: tetratricopeptide repeat protein [Candidatus Marinimicrobia bacterium]|nr:tetratricopeptide repeat protein [FCB group bacterium]MBL7024501.1 tetratricopeptide repeat protein [Candidatus Neomarinimicrobiota bacterium]
MSRLLFVLTLSAISIHATTSEIESTLLEKLFARDYEYVILETEKLLSIDSTDASAMAFQASALFYMGQTIKALQVFEEAYNLDPQSTEIGYRYATILKEIGYTTKAREVYQRLFLKDSTDISIVRPYAKITYESGEYGAASNLYKTIISHYPQDFSSQRMLAKCFMNTGEPELASHHYEQALRLSPDNANIIYDFARHEYSQNHLDQALDLIDKADRKTRSSTKFMLLTADIHFKKKEYILAIPFYNRLWLSGFKSEDVFKRMGYAYYTIAAYPRALELFQEALAMGDTDAATYYYIGKCYESEKQYDAAIESYKESIERLQPNYLMDLYHSMGSIYSSREDFPNAIEFYKKALELNPNSLLLNYFLADAYDSYYEDKSVALEYYKRAATDSISPSIDDFIKDRIKKISEVLFLKQ